MAKCSLARKKGLDPAMHGLPQKLKNTQAKILFMNCESALSWAYNTSSKPIVKLSMVNSMRMNGGHYSYPNSLVDNLNPQDRHGQAALIIGLIDRISEHPGRAYIKARFGRETSPAALESLVYFCADGLRIGSDKNESVYRVLKDYFGGNVSIRTVRKEIGCRHLNAVVTRHRLYTALNMLELRAMSELLGVLEERGIVQTV